MGYSTKTLPLKICIKHHFEGFVRFILIGYHYLSLFIACGRYLPDSRIHANVPEQAMG
jgi:hypothetical protein